MSKIESNFLLNTRSFLVVSFIMRLGILSVFGALLLPALVSAQLSGHVGPTTTRDAKRSKKVCNVLDYGGVASKTSDIGPPIASAFAACRTGGTGNSFQLS
jgi:rhamnogalacturonan hydrolase